MLGDPTPIGFLTTAAYLAAAAFCFASRHRTRLPTFFGVVAVAMALLGVNKEADLQHHLLEWGRLFAATRLPDVSRTTLAATLVVAVVGVALLAVVGARRLSRDAPEHARITLVGLVATSVFVVVRATTFVNLGSFPQFFRMHPNAAAFLELPGIALVLVGARHAVQANAEPG